MSDGVTTNPKQPGGSSRAGLIIGVVAVLVLLVVVVATRPGGAPNSTPQSPEQAAASGPSGSGEPPAAPTPSENAAKPTDGAPESGVAVSPNASKPSGPAPVTPPEAASDLPADHPPLHADESTLVSIQWFGHSCFYIHSPGGVCVVTDPFDPNATGLAAPNTGAHVVTVSSNTPQHNYVAAVHPFMNESGERQSLRVLRGEAFSQGDVRVEPIAAGGGQTAYLIQSGPLRILHLGNLRAPLSSAQIRRVGEVHVLMVPVGTGALTPKQAVSLCQAIKPRVVMPMAYATPEMQEEGVKLQGLDDFVAASPYAVTEQKSDVVLLSPAQLPATTEIYTLQYRR